MADDPIVSPADDLLDRAAFADALARTVEEAPHGSGFVIGLVGPWGDGKTSVLNMAASLMETRARVDVVRFNPWLFSGAEQLVGHFFSELAAQMGTKGPRGEAIARGLSAYAKVVAPLKWIPGVGQVLDVTAQMAEGVAGAVGGPPSVHEAAIRLRAQLRDLERPIAILIDDVDRLRAEEIADVVRLVRLVGDFPNLTYVLAFEQSRVEEALGGGRDRRAEGRVYLEKIVQVTFDLPAIPPEALNRLLLRAISDGVGDVEALTFDKDAFANVFVLGLRDFFGSLRDIRRFANVLPATVRLLGDEVELSDVLGMEGLRVFEPEVWAAVAREPELMTATSSIGYGGRDQSLSDRQKAHVEAVLAAAENETLVRTLLQELFPPIRRQLGGSHYGSDWETTWRRERRIASREVLQVYLARGVPAGTLPLSAVRRVMDAVDDRLALDAILADLDAGALERLFERLQDYEGRFSTAHPEHLVGALLATLPRLRIGRAHLYDMGADIALSRVLLRILRGRPVEEVERIVAAVEVDDLGARQELVLLVGHQEGVGSRLVSEEYAVRLEEDLAREIVAAPADALRDQRELARLLAFAAARDHGAFASRLDDWTSDVRLFLQLLRSAVLESVGQTTGRADVRHAYQLSWPALQRLVGQDLLARRVREHDDEIRGLLTDDILRGAWTQARRYAADPDAAKTDLERWERGSGGDRSSD